MSTDLCILPLQFCQLKAGEGILEWFDRSSLLSVLRQDGLRPGALNVSGILINRRSLNWSMRSCNKIKVEAEVSLKIIKT